MRTMRQRLQQLQDLGVPEAALRHPIDGYLPPSNMLHVVFPCDEPAAAFAKPFPQVSLDPLATDPDRFCPKCVDPVLDGISRHWRALSQLLDAHQRSTWVQEATDIVDLVERVDGFLENIMAALQSQRGLLKNYPELEGAVPLLENYFHETLTSAHERLFRDRHEWYEVFGLDRDTCEAGPWMILTYSHLSLWSSRGEPFCVPQVPLGIYAPRETYLQARHDTITDLVVTVPLAVLPHINQGGYAMGQLLHCEPLRPSDTPGVLETARSLWDRCSYGPFASFPSALEAARSL